MSAGRTAHGSRVQLISLSHSHRSHFLGEETEAWNYTQQACLQSHHLNLNRHHLLQSSGWHLLPPPPIKSPKISYDLSFLLPDSHEPTEVARRESSGDCCVVGFGTVSTTRLLVFLTVFFYTHTLDCGQSKSGEPETQKQREKPFGVAGRRLSITRGGTYQLVTS